MEEKTFLTVDEVAELLSVSKSKAYENQFQSQRLMRL